MSASYCNVRYFYLTFGVKLHRHQYSHFKHRTANGLNAHFVRYAQKKAGPTTADRVNYDSNTEPGQKKDVSEPLPAAYSSSYTEATWYSWWVKEGFFSPKYKPPWVNGDREKFVVCLPPPNVTGTLHLGHALTNSIQDALVRWNRMCGKEVLWIPGCDHAGIATQVVVEKKLWKEKKVSRHDLGRDKFVQEVWKWKEEKGDTIFKQMEKLGSSLDWSRSVFTMDEVRSKAVCEAFVRLHEEGLIYRSNRMVNWSCQLKSAISDIEVENKEVKSRCKLPVPGYDRPVEFGVLTSFAYPVHGSDEEVVVSTTRPETMLGDMGVAVHPDDPRYTHLHGCQVRHPLDNDRLIPIICDTFVDRDFGTGAVKITPAHDNTDFQVGLRHNLNILNVIDDTGLMENVPEKFRGMKRFDARFQVIKVLKELGLYRGKEDNPMVIPICSRSKDVIEPRLKEQWYLNCAAMAETAMKVVQDGELKLIPHHFYKMWNDFLSKPQDWCISRQLWWGHRIPAYKATVKSSSETGEARGVWISARDEKEAYRIASNKLDVPIDQISIQQDEDVLDTWFSSALFPFAAQGWPDQTEDLANYYPSHFLETGHDILFFWVARMVMLGQKLTGQLPFTDVLLHGILRDAQGRKMSKSLGNVIDPMDVIHGISLQELHRQVEQSLVDTGEVNQAKAGQRKDFPQGIPQIGADALRFTLCSYVFKSQEINLDISQAKTNAHFCNKIWQAFRFVQDKIPSGTVLQEPFKFCGSDSPMDAWILSRLSHMVKSCDKHFLSYDLQLVTKALYQFFMIDFCSVYLECVKPVFQSDKNTVQAQITREILHFCLDTFLRALNPFMPFLTEELYQRLQPRGDNLCESVCVAPYPKPEQYMWSEHHLECSVNQVKLITAAIATICLDHNLKKQGVSVCVVLTDPEQSRKLSAFIEPLHVLSRVSSITLLSQQDSCPEYSVRKLVEPGVEVFIPLKGLIDAESELIRQEKKRDKLQSKLMKLRKQLDSTVQSSSENQQSFSSKVESTQQKLDEIDFAISVIKKLNQT